MSTSITVEAWLTKDAGNPASPRYPVVLPTKEILEFASALDLTVKDLFDIYMPSGFSRVGHVKFLMTNEYMHLLYPPVAVGEGSIQPQRWWFMWRATTLAAEATSANNIPINRMEVYLLPPRPLFARNSLTSPAQPEGMYPPALFMITGEDNRMLFRGAQVNPKIYSSVSNAQNIATNPSTVRRDAVNQGTLPSANFVVASEFPYQQAYSSDGRVPPAKIYEVDALVKKLVESVWENTLCEYFSWVLWLDDDSDFQDFFNTTTTTKNRDWTKHKIALNWNNQPLAMALDMILSSCGAVLIPNYQIKGLGGTSYQYRVGVIDINDTIELQFDTQSDHGTVVAGGMETIRDFPYIAPSSYSDPLYKFWQVFGAPTNDINYGYCFNRLGSNLGISFPMRGPEQYQTTNDSPVVHYNSTYGDFGTGIDNLNRLDVLRELNLSTEVQWNGLTTYANNTFYVGTTNVRFGFPSLTKQILEPRVVPLREGGNSSHLDFTWGGLADSVTAQHEQLWDFYSYAKFCKLLVSKRNCLQFNKTLFGGWVVRFSDFCYTRLSYIRFHFAYVDGNMIPVTTTETDYDDWILGPNGNLPAASDPTDMVFSSGNVHARRVLGGALVIDVPPPTVRTFPAKIISATRLASSGDFYWRWRYEWEEVDPPTPADTIAHQVNNWVTPRFGAYNYKNSDRPWTRQPSTIKNYAFNLAENGNHFVGTGNAANAIATGVLQSDYTASTIDALPISVGTIVAMHENAMTMVSKTDDIFTKSTMKDSPFNSVFWFSIPNSVKVTCI